MSDKIKKVASSYTPESDELIALARVVRSLQGAKRFRRPLGALIQDRPAEIKKLEAPTQIDPETGKVKVKGKTGEENHKLFSQRVEELKKSIKKLDKAAIKQLLEQLENTKSLPKSANYIKIRDMLRSYLKDKENDADTSKK